MDNQMKQIQIKGGMIPKVLELLEAKRAGNQPILSFHSSQTANADVYALYLDDLLDYIKDVKEQTFKETSKEILQTIMNIIKKSDGFLAEEVIRIMAKQNGVKVE